MREGRWASRCGFSMKGGASAQSVNRSVARMRRVGIDHQTKPWDLMDMNYGGRWMDLLPLMIQVSPACELQKTCAQKWRYFLRRRLQHQNTNHLLPTDDAALITHCARCILWQLTSISEYRRGLLVGSCNLTLGPNRHEAEAMPVK